LLAYNTNISFSFVVYITFYCCLLLVGTTSRAESTVPVTQKPRASTSTGRPRGRPRKIPQSQPRDLSQQERLVSGSFFSFSNIFVCFLPASFYHTHTNTLPF